jgi:dynein heavy chain
LNPSDKGNPYDLKVVVFGLRDQSKYYTLSGKGITQYGPNGPVEFLSLGQWLLERDSYKHIRELDFFKQFKKWKFMRMWKKNIKLKKRSTASGLLEAQLFYLQDHFHESLLKHRKMMLDMSQKKFIDTCARNNESLTIEKFND